MYSFLANVSAFVESQILVFGFIGFYVYQVPYLGQLNSELTEYEN